MIYSYMIHRIGWPKVSLQTGTVCSKDLLEAIVLVQGMIRSVVTQKKISLHVLLEGENGEKWDKQYDNAADFSVYKRGIKKIFLSRQVEITEDNIQWYIAVGTKEIQVDQDKLEPLPFHHLYLTKLDSSRIPIDMGSRLIGPFESEEAARLYQERFGLLPIPERRLVKGQREVEKKHKSKGRRGVTILSLGGK